MWKSLSPLLLTLYFSGVPSVAMTRGTPDTSLAPADSLSQAQLEGGQRKGAQLEGGQLETVTVSATPFRGSLGTTTGSLSYLSTEQLRAGPQTHIPSSVTYDSYQQAPQNAAANWLEVAGHQRYHKILGGLRVRSQWTRNLSNKLVLYTLWKDAGEVRPFNHLSENTLTLGFKNQLQWIRGAQRLMAGVELFREDYRWQTHETLEAGARGDLLSDNQDHLQYRQSDQQQDGPQQSHSYRWVASPRLGLNHRIRKGLYLHSSAAHGFSAPTSEEALLPDGSINRNLQPEQGCNVEIGLLAAGDKQGWQADVTAYHLWVRNLLMTSRATIGATPFRPNRPICCT